MLTLWPSNGDIHCNVLGCAPSWTALGNAQLANIPAATLVLFRCYTAQHQGDHQRAKWWAIPTCPMLLRGECPQRRLRISSKGSSESYSTHTPGSLRRAFLSYSDHCQHVGQFDETVAAFASARKATESQINNTPVAACLSLFRKPHFERLRIRFGLIRMRKIKSSSGKRFSKRFMNRLNTGADFLCSSPRKLIPSFGDQLDSAINLLSN